LKIVQKYVFLAFNNQNRLKMIRIVILVLMHAAGDFLLQGSGLSKLKASKIVYLLIHVGIYTAFFIVLSPVLLGLTMKQGLIFSLINGSLHLIIDFITGKLKSMYWEKNEAKYIIVISFDHFFHILILIATYVLLFPEAFNSSLNLY